MRAEEKGYFNFRRNAETAINQETMAKRLLFRTKFFVKYATLDISV